MKSHDRTDPFLLRAVAKAAIVLCYQQHKPLKVPTSLWTTASGLPLTAANWKRLQRLALITWDRVHWRLTPEGARVLRANRIAFPARLVRLRS